MKKIFILSVIIVIVSLTGCSLSDENQDTSQMEYASEAIKDASSLEIEASMVTEDIEHTETVEETSQEIPKEILKFVNPHGEWFETIVDDTIEKHNYDWEKLSFDKNAYAYYEDTNFVARRGIDVSSHQGEIQWDEVKKAGVEFVILRAAYRGYGTEGILRTDSFFEDNYKAAKEAGLEIGVYIFSQAINEEEAKEEAMLMLQLLENKELDLPVVYDPELIWGKEARTNGVSGEQFTKNTITFFDIIETAGYQTMLYSNMYWEAFLFDMKELSKYDIWYADYEKIPQSPYKFQFLQYSESGRVPGIMGNVDLNLQFEQK